MWTWTHQILEKIYMLAIAVNLASETQSASILTDTVCKNLKVYVDSFSDSKCKEVCNSNSVIPYV